MAEYEVKINEGGIGAYEKTLTASTVDTVKLEGRAKTIRIISDGSAAIYFTVNGTAPTVKGEKTYLVPKSSLDFTLENSEGSSASTSVKLISAGTPVYSVCTAQSETPI